jgi:hypothetical protein
LNTIVEQALRRDDLRLRRKWPRTPIDRPAKMPIRQNGDSPLSDMRTRNGSKIMPVRARPSNTHTNDAQKGQVHVPEQKQRQVSEFDALRDPRPESLRNMPQ